MEYYATEKMKSFKVWSLVTGLLYFIIIGWFVQWFLIYKAFTLPEHKDKIIFIIGAIAGLFFLGWVLDLLMSLFAWYKEKH